MTSQEKNRAAQVMAERIRESGPFRLSQLHGIFEEAGIDQAIYNNSPKKWITEHFPQFSVNGSNGRETVAFADDPRTRIRVVLMQALEARGQILMSAVPDLLEGQDLFYKEYAGGMKLKDWLPVAYPEFKVSEDNMWLQFSDPSATQETGAAGASGSAGATAAAETGGAAEAEVAQMHAAAFMNWWTVNVKRLRQLTGDAVSENTAKTAVAHQFARAMLGLPGALIDGRGEEIPRAAVNSGLISSRGEPIYCVLIINPKNTDGTKQTWALEDFACAGDESELGEWLRMHEAKSAVRIDYTAMEDLVRETEALALSLIPDVAAYLEDLQAGRLPAGTLSGRLEAFEEACREMRRLYREFTGEEMEAGLPVQAVMDRVGGVSAAMQQLKNAVALFDEIAEETEAFLGRCGFPVGEVSTPDKDRKAVHEQYDGAAETGDFSLFRGIIRSYRALAMVMNAKYITDVDSGVIMEDLCGHFSEISPRYVSFTILGAAAEETVLAEKLGQLDGVESALNQALEAFRALAGGGTAEEKPEERSAAELLDQAEGGTHDGILLAEYAAGLLPEDEALADLVLGRTEDAANGEAELTFYAAARRLEEAVGNRDQLAERYYILGLSFDRERCAHALLSLYRREKRAAEYRRMTEVFLEGRSLNAEEEAFYMGLLAETSVQKALAYADSHYYLYYTKEGLEALLQLPDGALDPAAQEEFRCRLTEMYADREPDALEEALIRGDYHAVHELAENPEALAEMGYDDDQTRRIAQADEKKHIGMAEEGDYRTGIILYQYLKNKDRLAERYMWNGIASGPKTDGMALMVLLANEERWQEACGLYEHFREACSGNNACRQLYFIARINQDPATAKSFASANLQDCLAQIKESAHVREEVSAQAQKEGGEQEFYAGLLRLAGFLQDPFVCSVITMDRTLREYAAGSLPEGTELPEKYRAGMSALYKSDDYPHGRDAVSISERTWLFFGNYRGVSEAFARFALPDEGALALLWKIYGDSGEEAEQFALLEEYPALRAQHAEMYRRILFQREAYEEFLTLCDNETMDFDLSMKRFIAALRLNPDAAEPMPAIPDGEDAEQADLWMKNQGVLLMRTLYRSGRTADAAAVLFSCFERWPGQFDKDLLRALVTGGETAQADVLEEIRKAAEDAGREELAIYIGSLLQTGESTPLSKEYLDRKMDEIGSLDTREQIEALERLKVLFGNALPEADRRIMRLKLQNLREDDEMPQEERASQLLEVLSVSPAVPETVEWLLPLLSRPEIGGNPEVLRQVQTFLDQVEVTQPLLRFYHEMAAGKAPSERDGAVLGFTCKLYTKALAAGTFPEDILQEAYDVCTDFVRRTRRTEGVLALYFFEKRKGREDIAGYLLRSLADYSEGTLGKEMGSLVSSQLRQTWPGSLPGYFDLFREVLGKETLPQIRSYIGSIQAVSSLSANEILEIRASVENQQDQMLSESDSSAVLRLLFANPADASVWRLCASLPIQDNPLQYAKLYCLISMHNPDMWEGCVRYCEKYEQSELIPEAVRVWSSASQSAAAACRQYLEARLGEDPGYFDSWTDKAALPEIFRNLCDRVPLTELEYHATLRALSLIAVKSGFPENVKYLFDRFGGNLLGKCNNIGVVTAVLLLQEGRCGEASDVLKLLDGVLMHMNYREMVKQLAAMSPEELCEWIRDDRNQIKLSLTLPDGNTPNIEQIREVTTRGLLTGHATETAGALTDISSMFPQDYAVQNALYDLCCTRFEGFVPVLHGCLRGMIKLTPGSATAGYYRRKRHHHARMLAALDGVLIAAGKAGSVPDYDFKQGTGEFYRKWAADLPYSESLKVTELRDAVIDKFRNRSPEEIQRLEDAYLSTLTGNWMGLLGEAWREKRTLELELSVLIDENVEDLGFGRSLLRLAADMDSDERLDFLKWLKPMFPKVLDSRPLRRRRAHLNFAESFVSSGYFAMLEEQAQPDPLRELLLQPFEDYSYAGAILQRYVEYALRKKSDSLYQMSLLCGALVCRPDFQKEIMKLADEAFDRGEDRQAAALYHMLNDIGKVFSVYPETGEKGSGMFKYAVVKEKLEARYRISALFAGDPDIMAKVGGSGFHVWSCINLVLTMLYSQRADEVSRLMLYLSRENAHMAELILQAFNREVEDSVKIEAVDTLPDDASKLYYSYAIKYPYNPMNPEGPILFSICLGAEGADRVNRQYVALVRTLQKSPDKELSSVVQSRKILPSHTLLLERRPANERMMQQKDPQLWRVAEETADRRKPNLNLAEELPDFAADIAPAAEYEDIAGLKEQHRGMVHIASNIRAKLQLSRRIFACVRGQNLPQEELADALLLLGTDCYYERRGREDWEKARAAALQVAGILREAPGEGYGHEEAEKTMQSALYDLIGTFDTLQDLLLSYGQNRHLYEYLRSLLRDPLLQNCVRRIYDVLDALRSCYGSPSIESSDTLRAELSSGYRSLEQIENNRWMALKNRVQKLINDEINELDQRPMLQVEILNEGLQRCYGVLSGVVKNIGQARAENIWLQANYDNNSSSRQYVLDYLEPGSSAVCEINYSAAAGTEELEYLINISFSYDEKVYTAVACKGSLKLGELPAPDYPEGLLTQNPNGIIFEKNPETGEIYSPDFIGRKQETGMLRSLAEGDDFTKYKSAAVYGIRRTGKTSLLNYFEAYLEANRPDVIVVKTDCQAMPSDGFVQYVFVERVLDTVERRLPALADDPGWLRLKENWTGDNYSADRSPQKLTMFYTDVKQLIGRKGLYLIIDEIDRLFERVEEAQARKPGEREGLDSLFGAICDILNSAACSAAVHLVICGSNWLIRYDQKGDRKIQLLQRFGKQQIEVGRLPVEDSRDLICGPYRAYPQLTISREAIDWIWNYTSGLVWHTRLLGDEAISRARLNERRTVYPSDVQASLAAVITDQWCKQFYEGCESRDEARVVDAMQSLACRRDACVPLSKICELTEMKPVDAERSLQILGALKVVSPDPIDRTMYRFGQDIYRRYFRTTPSGFARVPEEPDVFQDKQSRERLRQDPAAAGSREGTAPEEEYDGFDMQD